MKQFLCTVVSDQRQGIAINFLKAGLWILSCFYNLGVRTIVFGYRTGLLKKRKLPKPVISVGNITVGGSGKTPLVIFIAQALRKRNLKAVILTRGYMDKKGSLSIQDSDEASMLNKILSDVPVVVGQDRFQKATDFAKEHPVDVFILDDGFQHWRLARDLNIVAIDTTNPFGNGFLIPRGVLREPLSHLSRADLIVLTKTDSGKNNLPRIREYLERIIPLKNIFEAIHKPIDFEDLRSSQKIELSFVQNKKVCLFCGLGDPHALRQTLQPLGCTIMKDFLYMDHHIYHKGDVAKINEYCLQHHVNTVVTTQKDAVKLGHLISLFDVQLTLLSLRICLELTQRKEEFVERIYSLFQH